MRKSGFILFVLFFLGLASCSPPPKPQLSKKMIKKVDSLYMANLDSVKNEIEIECQKRYSRIYQNAVDSFQILRQEEFESILKQ